MSPVVRPERDLVELFGYAPDDLTETARTMWSLGACPFIGQKCTKLNHDETITYGTCSATAPKGDGACIICPNRLYQGDYYVLRRIAAAVFGKECQYLWFHDYLKQPSGQQDCVVALGQRSGKEVKLQSKLSMDWVLARVKDNKLLEYVGVEVQSIDITGNYRDVWHAYRDLKPHTEVTIPSSEHGLNWGNVHKRLIPQLIRKGRIYAGSSLVKQGLHFVVPDVVYKRFEDILGEDMDGAAPASPNTLTIHTYDLSDFLGFGTQRTLVEKRTLQVDLNDFADRFVSGPTLPPPEKLDAAIRSILGAS